MSHCRTIAAGKKISEATAAIKELFPFLPSPISHLSSLCPRPNARTPMNTVVKPATVNTAIWFRTSTSENKRGRKHATVLKYDTERGFAIEHFDIIA
jgi:hypothetical protein